MCTNLICFCGVYFFTSWLDWHWPAAAILHPVYSTHVRDSSLPCSLGSVHLEPSYRVWLTTTQSNKKQPIKLCDRAMQPAEDSKQLLSWLWKRSQWKHFLQWWLYSSLFVLQRGTQWVRFSFEISVPLLGLVWLCLSRLCKAPTRAVPHPLPDKWVWPARLHRHSKWHGQREPVHTKD